MGPTRPQERAFGVFRWHSDSGFQVGEHRLFGAKFEPLDGAMRLHVDVDPLSHCNLDQDVKIAVSGRTIVVCMHKVNLLY